MTPLYIPILSILGTLAGGNGIHIIGEIQGCSGFDAKRLFVNFKVSGGSEKWRLIQGENVGQTWIAQNNQVGAYERFATLTHPVDLTFTCTSLQGWPSMFVQVNQEDEFGRKDLCGYGQCRMPTSPGTHNIKIPISRPRGSYMDDLSASFLGGFPTYNDPESSVSSTESRFEHFCVSTGQVLLEISIITKGFEEAGVHL
eukprot:469168_1